ncbi:hypothetical protein QC763_0065990 [Podospora pseudopauciseta]|uniref:Uncharacterized protein n=2 Tax=Podospora TaxID=5144 RepID=A0ABR0HCS4_9PEZI|nr:hypothetical protein QC763_0065990 [Podospora pseudopauciseta]KAK4676937.1 hypothetical protein QC764_0065590 [Podospora pseudoanserina]
MTECGRQSRMAFCVIAGHPLWARGSRQHQMLDAPGQRRPTGRSTAAYRPSPFGTTLNPQRRAS